MAKKYFKEGGGAGLTPDQVSSGKKFPAVWISGPLIGTGAAQETTHDLDYVPDKVFWGAQSSGDYVGTFTITPGTHTKSYVEFTADLGLTYQVIAWVGTN